MGGERLEDAVHRVRLTARAAGFVVGVVAARGGILDVRAQANAQAPFDDWEQRDRELRHRGHDGSGLDEPAAHAQGAANGWGHAVKAMARGAGAPAAGG